MQSEGTPSSAAAVTALLLLLMLRLLPLRLLRLLPLPAASLHTEGGGGGGVMDLSDMVCKVLAGNPTSLQKYSSSFEEFSACSKTVCPVELQRK